jgi:small ligand-binding sensory domain FIST
VAYYFTPPTVEEGPAGLGRLFDRYKLTRGITVLVTGGVATQTRYPNLDELDAADYFYLGGHRHEVSAEERTILLANGYTVEEA